MSKSMSDFIAEIEDKELPKVPEGVDPWDVEETDTAVERAYRYGAFLTIPNAAAMLKAMNSLIGNKSYTFISLRGSDHGDRHTIPNIDIRQGNWLEDEGLLKLTYYKHLPPSGADQYGRHERIPQERIDAEGTSIADSVHIGGADGRYVWGISSDVRTHREAQRANDKRPGDIPSIHLDVRTRFGKGIVIDQHAPCGDAIRWIIAPDPEPFEHYYGKIPTPDLPLAPLEIALKYARDCQKWNAPDKPAYRYKADLSEVERYMLDEAVLALERAKGALEAILNPPKYDEGALTLGELKDIPLFEGRE